MRAVRTTENGVSVVATDAPGQRGVRVSVTSAGICGSDLRLSSFGPSPVTLGHEFSGRLDDGTPVAVLPHVPCRSCADCLGGNEQRCSAVLGAMYGISLDGGMADAAWIDPSCARVLPASVRVEDAFLVEPLAVALHGIHRAGVGAGQRVLVIGGGPIGLCAVTTGVALGATIDLDDHHDNRLAAGERLGARVGARADNYDVVIDAAGSQGSLNRAVRAARPGATVCVLATYWLPVTIDASFQLKEVSLVPAFTYGHHHDTSEFDEAIGVLETSSIAEAIVTHRFSLDDASEAFRVASDRDAGVIKVVLQP